jgi:DNA-directed RNA polymerase specialized sigma subunit
MSLKDPKNQKMLNDFMGEHAPLIQKQVNILKSKGKVPPSVAPEDLHMHGFFGLMDALHKYDHQVASARSTKEGENTFAKYAERRIQGKMLDHLASQDQIPKAARTRAKNLAAMKDEGEGET